METNKKSVSCEIGNHLGEMLGVKLEIAWEKNAHWILIIAILQS